MKFILSCLLPFLFLMSCKQTENNKSSEYQNIQDSGVNSKDIAKKGKNAMENKCYLCHNPKTSKSSRVAPPMVALKARYIKDTKNKEEFVAQFWNFVEKPTKEKAKLKGAVNKFGLMPYQPYSQEDVEAIASYIYDYKIEEPEWFKSHWKSNHGQAFTQNQPVLKEDENQTKTYAELGLSYAKSTKATLGKNLMGAIQNKGVLHALSFCNVQAMPLTDSMATKFNASIKRVSNRNRNPANKANSEERQYISTYQDIISNGGNPEPAVVEGEKNVDFYYPIVTNDMCLKCHGTPNQEIQPETYKKINALYPKDEAIGYGVNEVRGIWHITFEK